MKTNDDRGGGDMRGMTSGGRVRAVLTAVLAGVAMSVVLALVAVALGTLGGSGLVGGLDGARRVLLVVGAIMLIAGSFGIASPERFGEAAAQLGRDLVERVGVAHHDGALSWYVQAVIAALTMEAMALLVDLVFQLVV